MKRASLLSALTTLSMIIMLTACSGPTSNATSTSSVPTLSETVLENSKQVFSVNYPKGWMTDTPNAGSIILATDGDIYQAMKQSSSTAPTLKSGQIVISIMAVPGMQPLGIKHGDSIGFLKKFLSPSMASGNITYTDPRLSKVGALDVAVSDITAPNLQGTTYAFWLDSPIKREFPYAAFWAMAVTAPGEFSKQQPIIEAILQSVKLLK